MSKNIELLKEVLHAQNVVNAVEEFAYERDEVQAAVDLQDQLTLDISELTDGNEETT